jgi:hypothetical protein
MPSPFPSARNAEQDHRLAPVTKIEHPRSPEALAGLVGLSRFELVPEEPCVYFLGLRGEVVYVGQTLALPARLAQHRRNIEFDSASFLRVVADDLNEVERAFILLFLPKHNGTIKPSDRVLGIADREWATLRLYQPDLPRPAAPDADRLALLRQWRGVTR